MNTLTTFQKEPAQKRHNKCLKNMKREFDSEEVENLQLKPNIGWKCKRGHSTNSKATISYRQAGLKPLSVRHVKSYLYGQYRLWAGRQKHPGMDVRNMKHLSKWTAFWTHWRKNAKESMRRKSCSLSITFARTSQHLAREASRADLVITVPPTMKLDWD